MTTPSSVLRFITAGSVDDGKSTLIGRLLYDSQTMILKGIDGKLIAKSTSIDVISAAGLLYAEEQGYAYADYAAYAADA